MGLIISKLLNSFLGKKDVRIIMTGLVGAGKTTILFKLKVGEIITTIPTVGFNVETVAYKSISFTIWDIVGQKQIRTLWYNYLPNTFAVIFVVDASDTLRIETAKEELHELMAHCELSNAVLLVYANKQDMPDALGIDELATRMDLHRLNQDWHVHATCATSGDGIFEGLEYLRDKLERNYRK